MFGKDNSPPYRATLLNPLYKATDVANDDFICIYFDYQNEFISDGVRAASTRSQETIAFKRQRICLR